MGVASFLGLAIQLAAFAGLDRLFVRALAIPEPGLFKYLSQLVGIGLAMTWNFLSNFHLTWACDLPSAPRPPKRRAVVQPRAQTSEDAAFDPHP